MAEKDAAAAFAMPAALLGEGYVLRPETDADLAFLAALFASTREEEFAVVPWTEVGSAGEDRLAEAGITVRCLQRADGQLGEGDDESLVAVVGKSY